MKRYNCTDAGSTYESYGEPIMQESPTGAYVLWSDVEKLIEALKFYADEMNYSVDDYRGISGEMIKRCVLYKDCEERNDVYSYAGMRARKALKELEVK